jgi:hypothetical protein
MPRTRTADVSIDIGIAAAERIRELGHPAPGTDKEFFRLEVHEKKASMLHSLLED